MSSCQDIIDRLGAAFEISLEWLALAYAETAPALDWVNATPGTVELDGADTDNLAGLVFMLTNLGDGFDRWVYTEDATPGTTAVTLPVLVDADRTRVFLNGVPLASPGDYSIVTSDTVSLPYPLKAGDWLEIRTYGG